MVLVLLPRRHAWEPSYLKVVPRKLRCQAEGCKLLEAWSCLPPLTVLHSGVFPMSATQT